MWSKNDAGLDLAAPEGGHALRHRADPALVELLPLVADAGAARPGPELLGGAPVRGSQTSVAAIRNLATAEGIVSVVQVVLVELGMLLGPARPMRSLPPDVRHRLGAQQRPCGLRALEFLLQLRHSRRHPGNSLA
eukprot:CAMPEP_0177226190 /NCGR_PEP_ID=MMETSP0367-20130122/39946_1 /TAXON_ID=447022 ORGANISM="Scrippsiella hangoei-like, Strain SHHI-4" /NCGR_SAMPLE_ID=MMETSP0367 /ASSEMBLY_ACC=CAM_ASM_000362 /LENGTH=134 /DNA_ID=CAMNT_0018676331 /DNA_START=676 /DNA_END=1076 /DNA_ORIENTATION=-